MHPPANQTAPATPTPYKPHGGILEREGREKKKVESVQPRTGLDLTTSPRTPRDAHCDDPITKNAPGSLVDPVPLNARSRRNLKLARSACAWKAVPTETHITCHIVAFPLLAAPLDLDPPSTEQPTQSPNPSRCNWLHEALDPASRHTLATSVEPSTAASHRARLLSRARPPTAPSTAPNSGP